LNRNRRGRVNHHLRPQKPPLRTARSEHNLYPGEQLPYYTANFKFNRQHAADYNETIADIRMMVPLCLTARAHSCLRDGVPFFLQ